MKGFGYAFENFIYVPIVSAAIGFLCSWLISLMSKAIRKIKKTKFMKKADVIDISGKWNSIFHEEGIIRSETVELKQQGQVVTGEMCLDSRKYILNGE